MEGHYTYFDHIIPQVTEADASSQKILLAALFGCGLIALAASLTSRLRTAEGLEGNVVPNEKVSLFGFFDLFVEVFVKYHDSVIGKENRHHVPFTGSIFLFILLANLIGLVPGMPAITTTVWVNVGMAVVVFIYFNAWGVKEQGFVNYFKHFLGPLWWLIPLMLPVEIISVSLRILTLNLRLYWNITADHLVLGVFSDLLPPFAAFPLYFLGTFVSFMQAFIFTTLTMIYILLATQHEEDH